MKDLAKEVIFKKKKINRQNEKATYGMGEHILQTIDLMKS